MRYILDIGRAEFRTSAEFNLVGHLDIQRIEISIGIEIRSKASKFLYRQ
jgi:hypothetical protein